MTGKLAYFRIWEGEPLPDIEVFRPFKCAVVIQSPPSSDWQDLVSEWLVNSGCLSMSAWGEGCSSWDDSVDHANLRNWNDGEIPDEHFVMTTWHDDEPLSEALGFVRCAAFHPEAELENCLLLDVGLEDRDTAIVETYLAAWAD